jgi:hypothetical protein
MAKKTKKEKLIEILEEMGCKEVQSKSRKYRSFSDPESPNNFYFVGVKGAVRHGRVVSKSMSFTEYFNNLLKLKENKSVDKQ